MVAISEKVVGNVFLYVVAICVFFLALITFLMVYFVIRYHRKRHPQPSEIEGNVGLEVLWTVVPTLLVLTMFYYGLTGFQFLRKAPEDAMKVKVIARQFSWLFEYENGMKDPELRVPVGKSVKLLLTSQDVIHGFYVPAFRIKQDVVPGMETTLWFRSLQVGKYDILCTQYCGLRHANMSSKVVVLPEEEFAKWYQQGKETKEAATKLPRGAQLFQEKGCFACHTTDGTPRVGPTLKGLYGKTVEVLTGGKERKVVADEAYLRKSILDPNADVGKGFPPVMPQQKFTEEETTALVEYIKGLK